MEPTVNPVRGSIEHKEQPGSADKFMHYREKPSPNQQHNMSNNNKPSMNGTTEERNSIVSQTPDRSSYQVYVGSGGLVNANQSPRVESNTALTDVPDGLSSNRRYSRSEQCDCNRSGCGPLLANNLAYFGAVAFFIAAVNVKFLPDAPFPVIGNSLPTSLWLKNEDMAAVMPLLLWALHFVRRFTEVLFVHKYTRHMPYGEAIGASVYYWGFGFWIGYSANFYLGKLKYFSPSLCFLIPGLILFVIGEVGNCAVHIAQRRMRIMRNHQPSIAYPRDQRILPSGFLFRYVSCPNYTFEIVTWIGFFLVVFTLPAGLFLIASIITLIIYAGKKHKNYQQIFTGFDGKELYPANRKALIPFIF